MTETKQNLDMYAGDDKEFTVQVFNEAGDYLDITGNDVYWDLVTTFSDVDDTLATPGVLRKSSVNGGGITVIDAHSGFLKVTLSHTDTASLGGQYVQVVRLVHQSTGFVKTIMEGDFLVRERKKSAPCTYSTPEKVSGLLRLTNENGNRFLFSETTDPRRSEVIQYINWAEGQIDKTCNHAWRAKTISERWYNFPLHYSGLYSRWYTIFLGYRDIRSITMFKVFHGNTFEDWLTGRTEGPEADWFVDKSKGILYLKFFHPLYLANAKCQLSFTYGEATVPEDIEEAATKLAAVKILENDYSRVAIPDGYAQDPSRSGIIRKWTDDAERIMRRRMSYITVGTI